MAKTKYKIHNDLYPYFLTCTTIQWVKIFKNPEFTYIILESLKHLITNNRIKLHAWVIMPDHLHLIASSEQLAKQIGQFKSYTARSIIDLLIAQKNQTILNILEKYKKDYKTDQQYQLWQEGSQPKMIHDFNMLEQKINYVHYNPVEGKLVSQPEEWVYSSYLDYYGDGGILPIEIIEQY